MELNGLYLNYSESRGGVASGEVGGAWCSSGRSLWEHKQVFNSLCIHNLLTIFTFQDSIGESMIQCPIHKDRSHLIRLNKSFESMTQRINNLLRNEPAAAFSHRTTHTWFEESGSVDPITSVHSRKILEDASRPPSAARSAPEPKHKH